MRVLALSPHLDDAAFSAGATLAALVRAGHDVRLATAFTRSVPDPRGFALACQTDKGLAADVDYLALRRAEDRAAATALGIADVVHLDHAEAPHRGYESAAELFAGVHEDDDPGLDDDVAALCAEADLVLTAQAVGDHVDHHQVLLALGRVAPAAPVVRWRDEPYAARRARPAAHTHPCAAAKLDACAAYATQLGFQFGGEAELRAWFGGVPEAFDAPLEPWCGPLPAWRPVAT